MENYNCSKIPSPICSSEIDHASKGKRGLRVVRFTVCPDSA